MPTQVSSARQCLTAESAEALDEAVRVARRRGHAQTTSLHALSALLSLPSSPLRHACSRSRSSSYSPRLQLKALDLCLSVSLDRLSSSSDNNSEPPVSNSLMAAIKRSQATQRRNPDNYHLYHNHNSHLNHSNQLSNSTSGIACVRVELQHLILSILDDPVVSRVFGEAGFRSSDVKMAVLRPFSQLLRYRAPPVFLCSLADDNHNHSHHSYYYSDGDFARIGEVLTRKRGRNRNPLLVGVCALDALRSFSGSYKLDGDLDGVRIVSVESDFEALKSVGLMTDGGGIVLSFGDLIATFFSGDRAVEAVSEITRLLEVYGGKVWVIGATASYESYLKFVSKFPSVEKDWDLQLLPITRSSSSSSPSSNFMAESYPKSSLMDSFIPFGGFFSAPSDPKFPLTGPIQCHVSRSQEASNSFPSWLQIRPSKGSDVKTPQPPNFPTVVGFRSSVVATDRARVSVDLNSSISIDDDIDEKKTSEMCDKLSKSESEPDQRSDSPASVTTDLGLGITFLDRLTKPQSQCRTVRSPTSTCRFDLSDVKAIFRALVERVGWQWEAVGVVGRAIVRRKMMEKGLRGDIWLSFVGPDKCGKKRVVLGLAEILYGKEESSIFVDLIRSESSDFGDKFRGKNVVDYVLAEISKKPLSLVFLENVDKSDVLVRRSLSRAISTGKFSDSYGREISTNNTTFIVSTSSSSMTTSHSISNPRYSEERVSKAKRRQMRIVIESSFVLDPILVNKRKSTGLETVRRSHKKHLDLNLPAETEDDEWACENSEAWFQDFCDKVDETVDFKPVDFDAIAEKISGLIKNCFERIVGSSGPFEIESGAMEQLIAAAYFSDDHRVVEDWVERVLTKGFEEAKKKHSNSLSSHSIVKLVSCEGLSLEDQPQTCYLPSKIIIN